MRKKKEEPKKEKKKQRNKKFKKKNAGLRPKGFVTTLKLINIHLLHVLYCYTEKRYFDSVHLITCKLNNAQT